MGIECCCGRTKYSMEDSNLLKEQSTLDQSTKNESIEPEESDLISTKSS